MCQERNTDCTRFGQGDQCLWVEHLCDCYNIFGRCAENPLPTPTPTPDEIGGGGGDETCENYWDWWVCMQDHALWMDYPECRCEYTPIVIDILGNGFALSDPTHGVMFDLSGHGTPRRIAWTTTNSDDGWMALDRNGNGLIDNGTELFGNVTSQPAPPSGVLRNGFLALAEYDKAASGGNGDGTINRPDAIFESLRLWQDRNHNGVSEPSELHGLRSLGVAAIDLDYKESRRQDKHGNTFRYRAKIRDTRGAHVGRWAWDVFLLTENSGQPPAQRRPEHIAEGKNVLQLVGIEVTSGFMNVAWH